MHIYLDCPSVSRTKLFIESTALMVVDTVEIYENSQLFGSLEAALDTFKCRALISVLPGTLLHFYGDLKGNSVLVSFMFKDLFYSMSIQKGEIVITTSAGVQSIPHIALSPPIGALGKINFYLYLYRILIYPSFC